jgi:uncharacterized protein YndB with AHSA1/START domain
MHNSVRRQFELDVQVRGTVSDVWAAIATGPGLTSWFVPAEVEERLGGEVLFHFGEYGTDICRVSAWEPPRRFEFATEQRDRTIRQELVVHEGPADEHGAPSCRVAFRNHGYGADGSSDEQIAAMTVAWRVLLDVLRLSLLHFPGRPCATTLVNGCAPGRVVDVWTDVGTQLGLVDPQPGDEVRIQPEPDGPVLHGKVASHRDQVMTLLLLDPAPAILMLGVQPMGGGLTHVAVYSYSYDEDPRAEVRALGRLWQAWMDRCFPMELGDRHWEPPKQA